MSPRQITFTFGASLRIWLSTIFVCLVLECKSLINAYCNEKHRPYYSFKTTTAHFILFLLVIVINIVAVYYNGSLQIVKLFSLYLYNFSRKNIVLVCLRCYNLSVVIFWKQGVFWMFTNEHEMFRDALKKMLHKEAYPYFEQWEREREIPRSFWEKLGESGFLCPMVSEEYGGLGLDFSYSMILTEELERVGAGLASGIALHSDIVTPYIETYGTEEQKRKWLPDSVRGKLVSAIAMTEPGAGSDLANIQTVAQRVGDYYVLNGEKTFITNGIGCDYAVVVCKTDPAAVPAHRGISLLVVETGTEGFKKGKKLDKVGLHSADTGELIFEDAKVPIANLLGEEGRGFYYLMEKLQQERLIVAIEVLIEAEEMLAQTIRYVKERKAFGSRIADFQNTQFKLAEMATEVDIGRTYVNSLVGKHVAGAEIVKEVSMAKWWLSDLAKKVASDCMQLHGGYGYMEEYEIARRYRDVPVAAIYAGTNEIMKGIIAKQILK